MVSSAVDFGFDALRNSVLGLSKAQKEQNAYSSAEAAKARDFSAQQAEISRDWQEDMYAKYNSLQGKVSQARAAGVNPLFAVTGSAVSPMETPAASPASPAASPFSVSPLSGISDMTSAALGFGKLSAEIQSIRAHTRRENGEAFLAEIRAQYEGRKQEATIAELVSVAERNHAEVSYLLSATEEKFARIGLIYAETENTEERTKLISEEINKCIAEVSNIEADTKVKAAMYQQIGAQIRNLDADTQYKAYLCGLALEQQLTEMSKRDEISAHISWLADDAARLRQATSNAEAEEVLLKMEKDIKDWQTKQAKRNYKWSLPKNVVGMVTDVTNSAANLIGAVKGTSVMPTFSNGTYTHIDGNSYYHGGTIGYK